MLFLQVIMIHASGGLKGNTCEKASLTIVSNIHDSHLPLKVQ